MKPYSFIEETLNLYSNIKYRDPHGNIVGDVSVCPIEGDGYKHCHVISKKLKKKIALHLNVPAYYIHKEYTDTFNKKELIDFITWLDSKSPNQKLTWWQFLVNKWNADKETQKNTRLRIKTSIRPPYENGIYMSYHDCIKANPDYKKW